MAGPEERKESGLSTAPTGADLGRVEGAYRAEAAEQRDEATANVKRASLSAQEVLRRQIDQGKSIGDLVKDASAKNESYATLFERIVYRYNLQNKVNISDDNFNALKNNLIRLIAAELKVGPNDPVSALGMTLNTNVDAFTTRTKPGVDALKDKLIALNDLVKSSKDPKVQSNGKINLDYFIDQVPALKKFIKDPNALKRYIQSPALFDNIRAAIEQHLAPPAKPAEALTEKGVDAKKEPKKLGETAPKVAEKTKRTWPHTFETEAVETKDGNFEDHFLSVLASNRPEDAANGEVEEKEYFKKLSIQKNNEFDPKEHDSFKVEKDGENWKVTYLKTKKEESMMDMIKKNLFEFGTKLSQEFEKSGKGLKGLVAVGLLLMAGLGDFFKGLWGNIADKTGARGLFEKMGWVEKSPDNEMKASKAAFEKVSKEMGLNLPSDDWFKKQQLVKLEKDQTWEQAWDGFFKDEKVSRYRTVAKQAGNTDTGLILSEAVQWKTDTSGKTPEDFYKEKRKKPEDEKAKLDEVKNTIKEQWNLPKRTFKVDWEITDELAQNFVTWKGTDINKNFAAFVSETVKDYKESFANWCLFLESKNEKLNLKQLTFLKVLEATADKSPVKNLTKEELAKAFEAYTTKYRTTAGTHVISVENFMAEMNIHPFNKDQLKTLFSGKWPTDTSPKT